VTGWLPRLVARLPAGVHVKLLVAFLAIVVLLITVSAVGLQALNRADRSAGPAITDVAGRVRPAVCAGLDHLGTMVSGSPEDCAREVEDAIWQAGGRPLLIAPGCTFDPAAVCQENLHAICRAGGALG